MIRYNSLVLNIVLEDIKIPVSKSVYNDIVTGHQSEMAGAFCVEWRCFHVPDQRSVPAGGAGEYQKVLLDGENHHKSRDGISLWI